MRPRAARPSPEQRAPLLAAPALPPSRLCLPRRGHQRLQSSSVADHEQSRIQETNVWLTRHCEGGKGGLCQPVIFLQRSKASSSAPNAVLRAPSLRSLTFISAVHCFCTSRTSWLFGSTGKADSCARREVFRRMHPTVARVTSKPRLTRVFLLCAGVEGEGLIEAGRPNLNQISRNVRFQNVFDQTLLSPAIAIF